MIKFTGDRGTLPDMISVIITLTILLFVQSPILKAGEKAAEEAGKLFGQDAWEQAKALWNKLRPQVETKPAAKEAIKDAADNPDDEDVQAALRVQLKKLLKEDTALTNEINRLMEGKVVQRVLAERKSTISNVEQSATGESDVQQETVARDESKIEGVKQRQQ
ncbi:MAG: hypothetical protein F6K18_23735 [Okeania sp. SIO2C2]|uniref:hypothetical protein n=1 Tax=Okeania sp. SIO2C2 TaxID=2607787 RepID=UPI0013BD8931|nr:hypothetical protein [Okeania sp. SIO2C2]NEP89602.1 hypothetical protein [Okeania sp. SIO2C2]